MKTFALSKALPLAIAAAAVVSNVSCLAAPLSDDMRANVVNTVSRTVLDCAAPSICAWWVRAGAITVPPMGQVSGVSYRSPAANPCVREDGIYISRAVAQADSYPCNKLGAGLMHFRASDAVCKCNP